MTLEALKKMREFAGSRETEGLSDEAIKRFLALDPQLGQAIETAAAEQARLRETDVEIIAAPEAEAASMLQTYFSNFYDEYAINPYIALAAKGPWIVTTHGAVLHDSGGYGMLGFGHNPTEIMEVLAKPMVIANIMTPSISQKHFAEALRRELGHSRGACPFESFVCMNSGSEAVTVAARISDINAHHLTRPGARYEAAKIRFLALEGGFHGRTDRPAQASGSTQKAYRTHLASFQNRDTLTLVPPNDIAALEAAFARAKHEGVFFEMMLMEPVMGEGNPGMAVTREFYDRARELTNEMGTFLLVDSIQAGLRAQGCLSIVDYPGFQTAEAPDLETYSKALNAAQYPLSVLAMGPRAATSFRRGVYGNTMTTNPRAIEVGTATLNAITPELRQNIRDRGVEFVDKLNGLRQAFPGLVKDVQGCGLLVSITLDHRVPVLGPDGIERYCRVHGMGVIHGGDNALRFTPPFTITSAEIDLMIDVLRDAMEHYQPSLVAAE